MWHWGHTDLIFLMCLMALCCSWWLWFQWYHLLTAMILTCCYHLCLYYISYTTLNTLSTNGNLSLQKDNTIKKIRKYCLLPKPVTRYQWETFFASVIDDIAAGWMLLYVKCKFIHHVHKTMNWCMMLCNSGVIFMLTKIVSWCNVTTLQTCSDRSAQLLNHFWSCSSFHFSAL